MDISDIAKLAGVSPSTVSKVINHKDSSISDATRERVLKIVREYHYSPYSRSRATKDWLIGVVFRSPISLDSTLDGILNVAQRAGYAPLVLNSNLDLEQERKNLEALKSTGAAGVIWEPVNGESLSYRGILDASGAKVVTIGANGGDLSLLIPYEKATYEITAELIGRDHRRIGCLVTEGRRTPDFIQGFKRCLFEHGMAFTESLIHTEVSADLLGKIGSGELTGIVCSHYQMAKKLHERLATLHYHTPDDVSIVSLRNDSGTSWTDDPGDAISTYTIKNSDFGRLACERLIGKMTGKPAAGDHFDGLKLNNTNSLGNPPTSRSKHAVVVGSINIDTRLSVPTLPDEGKTVTTDRSLVYPGGKGTNQAAGLAKLGHRVALVGDVGADASSDVVYRTLEHWEVDTTGVYRKADVETGKAYIFVDPEGQSMITVLSGANAFLSADDLAAREQLFEGAQYCLVQTEIPLDAVLAALRTARHHGAKTILKPAACDVLPDEILQRVDILVPNLPELNTIVPGPGTIEERAAQLAERCGGTVIVTLGAGGCYLPPLPRRQLRCRRHDRCERRFHQRACSAPHVWRQPGARHRARQLRGGLQHHSPGSCAGAHRPLRPGVRERVARREGGVIAAVDPCPSAQRAHFRRPTSTSGPPRA